MNRNSGERWFKSLVWIPILLTGIGLCLIYSSRTPVSFSWSSLFFKQVLWAVIALAAGIVTAILPIRYLRQNAYLLYGLSLLSLILVLLIGSGPASRWFDFGFFRLQPSEWAKAFFILALARLFSDDEAVYLSPGQFFVSGLMMLIPFTLILLQPDFGTSLVFPVIWLILVYWRGIPPVWWIFFWMPALGFVIGFHRLIFYGFICLLLIVILMKRWPRLLWGSALLLTIISGMASPRLWGHLRPYQQGRILTFLGVQSDPFGSAYQVIQSKVAIGSGGLFGKGFMGGSQTQLRFLPEHHTDFIFSVLGEEFGFLGTILVLGLFALWIFKGLQSMSRNPFPFLQNCAIGITGLAAFQIIVNIGMTVDLMPVTGLPLPFLSYGGSSLILFGFLAGLLINLNRRSNPL